ncbi:1-aminocyclopropane-1-carboxylate deaminase/D-cysteine desulfhydrase [Nonlabens ponticola]|uniref:Pyridoxal-phosphate dependent enzyme n=1 Tax=Nonlabens ponticola TaxID=2496866 RepID=A0A3S9MXA1_9FLAO|nr:pyridoxal-phosphate dependent enzyme [Nonlabens ponticola]AZQ43820.1 pyridoxal-phosphate dependent enzyme [Nonlabens ponticola]
MTWNLIFEPQDSINQLFKDIGDTRINIKRDDLLHPSVSGNKLRKLKYNLRDFLNSDKSAVLTYGGAHSNHIAATAAAGQLLGIQTIGVIRGEELAHDIEKTLQHNSTLRLAHDKGMKLHFMDRESYKHKNAQIVQNRLVEEHGNYYDIPEGGTNDLAIKGTAQILTENDKNTYQIIAVAAGTGGTAAGIIESSSSNQFVFVFSALKGDFLKKEISKYTRRTNFEVVSENTFGGYARSNDVLISYMNVSFRESGIPLDPIYTAKMMYGLELLIQQGVISSKTRILAIHTGGLQGIKDYNAMLLKKGRITIDYASEIL